MVSNNTQAWVHGKENTAENTDEAPAWYTLITAPKGYNSFK